MSGIEVQIDTRELTVIADRLNELGEGDKRDLLDGLGALGVSQTQERIAREKRSPDGVPWKPNRQGTSILFHLGHLLGSMAHQVGSDRVSWGSNMIYAAVHQLGATIRPKSAKRLVFRIGNQTIFAKEVTIPARPYLGFSAENISEIRETVHNWLQERLQ